MAPTDQLFASRYRLENRLGVGGMSTVQLAFDTRLERYVAVKLLAEHLAEDPGFVARFRREALAAARLVHPNVVQVFDFGLDDASGRQYIVMEHVEGHSCAEILRDQGHLEPADAVDILVQACRGLEYAHRNGVIHRDVKPGNLLRSLDGVVKLADFGIAKASEQSDITRVGSVLGTAAYLAPEQARGEPAGPAADLYSLGVVAYQLLTGRLPYEGLSLTELARLQDSGPPERLDRVNPGVPPALSAAVLRALHRDPEGRFADGPEMEEALRDGLHGVEPEPSPSTTTALPADEETEATRMLSRDAVRSAAPAPPAAPRRRLEPLADEYAPPPRRAAAAAAPPATAPRKRGGAARTLLILLAVLALVAGGAAVVLSQTGGRSVQLREDVRGDAQQSLSELRGLIEDNTR
ncbi:MAG TPA: protein kinase [Solirubrobacteraceae bacterium]|jgi:serine/threonine-protein kinase